MTPDKPPAFTDEQRRDLQREAFFAEVLKIRGGDDRKSDKKNWFLRFLETTGGTALVTVLLGGVLGTIINSCAQASLKERETAQAYQKFKGELAVMDYRNYLDKRQEAMRNLYDLVGRCASSCHTLISRTGVDTSKYPTRKDEVINQSQEIYQDFQARQEEWHSKQDSLGLLVSYYYGGNSNVVGCWNTTMDSVNGYMECADKEYQAYTHDYIARKPADICRGEKGEYEKQISAFTQCIQGADTPLWKEYFPEPSGQTAPK